MKKLLAILVLGLASVAMAAPSDVEAAFVIDITDPANVLVKAVGKDITFDGFDLKGPAGSITDFAGGYAYPKMPMDFLVKGFAVLSNNSSLFGFASLSASMTMTAGSEYNLGDLVTTDDVTGMSVLVADAGNAMGYGDVYSGVIVPEPASMSMLALGALALIRRRR